MPPPPRACLKSSEGLATGITVTPGCAMPHSRSMHFCASDSQMKRLPSCAGSGITRPSTPVRKHPAQSSSRSRATTSFPSRRSITGKGIADQGRFVSAMRLSCNSREDIYGELMDAFYLSNKYVSPTSYDVWEKIRNRLDWICENWCPASAGNGESVRPLR